jgi:hypothetical protein
LSTGLSFLSITFLLCQVYNSPFKGRVGWGWCLVTPPQAGLTTLVIPAALNSEAGQAGIQFFLGFDSSRQSFHSACGRAGNFSLPVQRKVTKRKHVGLRPRFYARCAERLRRWLLRIRRGSVTASQRSFHTSRQAVRCIAGTICGLAGAVCGYLDGRHTDDR